MTDDLFAAMRQAIIDGDPARQPRWPSSHWRRTSRRWTRSSRGSSPACRTSASSSGQGELFLPDMMLAARAMQKAVAVLEPEIQRRATVRRVVGRVVIGTVKGDIHEIGKNLVGMMLSTSGFEVHDLGVDVAPDRFVEAAREHDADLVGVSALLTTTMAGQRTVVEALAAAGLRPKVKVIVGGAPASATWASEIGADGYSEDAIGAVALARKLLGAAEATAGASAGLRPARADRPRPAPEPSRRTRVRPEAADDHDTAHRWARGRPRLEILSPAAIRRDPRSHPRGDRDRVGVRFPSRARPRPVGRTRRDGGSRDLHRAGARALIELRCAPRLPCTRWRPGPGPGPAARRRARPPRHRRLRDRGAGRMDRRAPAVLAAATSADIARVADALRRHRVPLGRRVGAGPAAGDARARGAGRRLAQLDEARAEREHRDAGRDRGRDRDGCRDRRRARRAPRAARC